VLYTEPCRYNWMLQFYLRAQGLELSWIGSGRFIMSLNYSDEDFAEVVRRIEQAAEQMKSDGWWWSAPHLSNKWIKRQMLKDMLADRFGRKDRGRASAPSAPGAVSGLATTVEETH
jgi:glutamate-1-semialdehyde 2,1-aminomutase